MLEGLRKDATPDIFDQFRYIGLTVSLWMWYTRILVSRMEAERAHIAQRRRAHTYGFPAG